MALPDVPFSVRFDLGRYAEWRPFCALPEASAPEQFAIAVEQVRVRALLRARSGFWRASWAQLRGCRPSTEALEDMLEALGPLRSERPGDGELARFVGQLFALPDSHYAQYRQILARQGRPITRLECLDIVSHYEKWRLAEYVAARRVSDAAAIAALGAGGAA